MSNKVSPVSFDHAQHDAVYLKRRVQEEASAAASAHSLAATLIHVELATAYAKRCCNAGDQTGIAEHRLW